jgi:adenosylmethionine-8-amino-7-oxononanoate aminotransferase
MTLAATLTTEDISRTISDGEPGVFMHGPTFMANPLACTAANTSIGLLLDSPWHATIARIEEHLLNGLQPCGELNNVKDVRVLGAIGVVEMHEPVDMKTIQPMFVDAGVWVRPFGRLVYLMPPYIINGAELDTLTAAVCEVLSALDL